MAHERAKQAAAEGALAEIKEDMVVGLGSGSTAEIFVRLLGAQVKDGKLKNIQCVASSERTAEIASEVGLKLLEFEAQKIDTTIDGADEIDRAFRAIKGGGGCHLREKVIARQAKRTILIVDESKCVEQLGAFPLPLEITPSICYETEQQVVEALRTLGYEEAKLSWRATEGQKFITDNDNFILDCHLRKITDPKALADRLTQIAGMVEHGLFLDEVDAVIIGKDDGTFEIRNRS